MKAPIAAVAGFGALAALGALFGLEAVAAPAKPLVRPARSEPITSAVAVERLMLMARRGGERREFTRLIEAAGDAAPKEELLAIAAGSRRNEVLSWLLGVGARAGGGSKPGAPLLAAAAAGDSAGVRLLLSAGAAPDPDLGGPMHRTTPLIAAIAARSLDCADALLEAGADPRRQVVVPGFTLDVVRRPAVLRTTPSEARRLRAVTALELAQASRNPTMVLVVNSPRKCSGGSSAGR